MIQPDLRDISNTNTSVTRPPVEIRFFGGEVCNTSFSDMIGA